MQLFMLPKFFDIYARFLFFGPVKSEMQDKRRTSNKNNNCVGRLQSTLKEQ